MPSGFLPVFSVGSEEEASRLLVATCPRSLEGEHYARELAEEQTLEHLEEFSTRIDRAHDRLVMAGLCDCQKETTMATKVKAKCIGCSATREIGPGEIAPGDQPMCTKCGMPMIAAGATTKTEPTGRTPRPGGKKARLARGAKVS